MRSTTISLVLLTLVVGCEHKSKSEEPTTNAATAADPVAASPAAPEKPDPVAVDPGASANKPAQPAQPAQPEQAVRAPVAADLAEYTKDLGGNGALMATFETSMGKIHCELFGDKAPMTVANFVGLATGKKAWTNPKTGNTEQGKPFYDNLVFHRVIPEFMIQGGDPLGRGTGGPGYRFGDETQNGLTMKPGTLAMANAGPGTNGSQFFITEGAPEWLNGKHTIFGQCKEVDLVKQIARVPQNAQNKPNTPVTMKVTISRG